ncbi:MAG: hypothetical protein ACI90V_009120 [Bacillariaceae sp.]|jgi:hypothetical protein
MDPQERKEEKGIKKNEENIIKKTKTINCAHVACAKLDFYGQQQKQHK